MTKNNLLVTLLVSSLYKVLLELEQGGGGGHVPYTDGEPPVHEKPAGHPGQPPHGNTRGVLSEIPEKQTNIGLFIK